MERLFLQYWQLKVGGHNELGFHGTATTDWCSDRGPDVYRYAKLARDP